MNKNSIAKSQSGKGFTLAEVLITLGIIGIVAAMTIPTLINNTQKSQYATTAKKAYAQMNQVLQQMSVDSGTVGSIADYFGDTATVGAKIASYYKVIKNCGMTAGDECFAKFDDNYDGSANATGYWTGDINTNYKFVTADGLSYAIVSWNNSCKTNRGFDEAPDSPVYNSCCGFVYMDVNGTKKPNCFGRDVFLFYITSKKTPLLYPTGGFYHSSSASAGTIAGGGDYWWNMGNRKGCGTGGKEGYYCPGRLMENGWVMDY